MPIVAASALPVLAVGRVGLRRVGLVVLDRRCRVRHAKVLDLRRKTTSAERLDAVRAKVSHLVRKENVGMVVVESATTRSPSPAGFRDVFKHVAEEEGAWLQERSIRTALADLGNDSPKATVLAELATEYRELAARLDFRRPSLFRGRDHERDVRPLVHAFLLAHAVSIEASRGASRPTA